ncbi:hypothetical protein [Caproiciproducens sp. CPB-2]|uniref:hypothetical protein n=1 Tax=Caproiciproducens sp. CPB-2 TaxID=3030017 RepID=UPI0023DB64D8|nr:hypothetical protein [Caproiciproducens sp. CPB-2]MDF1496238.1 hypothetical protein [Caproiciproducens sp. CPB-2]
MLQIPSMAQIIADLEAIEEKIKNQQVISSDMLQSIQAAKQITIAFELLNISSSMSQSL